MVELFCRIRYRFHGTEFVIYQRLYYSSISQYYVTDNEMSCDGEFKKKQCVCIVGAYLFWGEAGGVESASRAKGAGECVKWK